jgi:deferrochelatase/peroxidase EfeB
MPDLPLCSIQGNIVKSFRRNHGTYLMLRFHADIQEKRAALAVFLDSCVTSACQQREIAETSRDSGQSHPLGMFGLSHQGYERLGLQRRAPQDIELGADLFRNPKAVTHYFGPDSKFVEPQYVNGADAFLLIADSDKGRLTRKVRAATDALKEFAADVIPEHGYRLLAQTSSGQQAIEHFGFRDEISKGPDPESVLTDEPKEPGYPSGLGCYAVFMKLEQDVAAFNSKVDELSSLFMKLHVAAFPDEVRARIMGRAAYSGKPVGRPDADLEAFDFSDDPKGEICPLQSHARAMNPRDGRKPVIVRRGLSYGPVKPGRKGARGLLFLGLQRSLLEFSGLMARAGNLRDPILSRSETWDTTATADTHCPHGFRAQVWHVMGREVCFQFADVTRLRFGQSFYIPSMDFIRNLHLYPVDQGVSASPPAQLY